MKDQNYVILGDAIDCLRLVSDTHEIIDKDLRESEIDELIARAINDIKTVIRNERVG